MLGCLCFNSLPNLLFGQKSPLARGHLSPGPPTLWPWKRGPGKGRVPAGGMDPLLLEGDPFFDPTSASDQLWQEHARQLNSGPVYLRIATVLREPSPEKWMTM